MDLAKLRALFQSLRDRLLAFESASPDEVVLPQSDAKSLGDLERLIDELAREAVRAETAGDERAAEPAGLAASSAHAKAGATAGGSRRDAATSAPAVAIAGSSADEATDRGATDRGASDPNPFAEFESLVGDLGIEPLKKGQRLGKDLKDQTIGELTKTLEALRPLGEQLAHSERRCQAAESALELMRVERDARQVPAPTAVQLAEAKAEVRRYKSALEEAERELAQSRARVGEQDERAAISSEQVRQLQSALERTMSELQAARSELTIEKRTNEDTRTALKNEVVTVRAEHERVRATWIAELESARTDRGRAVDQLETVLAERASAESARKGANAELEVFRDRLEELRLELEVARAALEAEREELESARSELDAQRSELASARAEVGELRSELAAAEAAANTLRADGSSARDEAEASRAALRGVRAELAAARDERDAALAAAERSSDRRAKPATKAGTERLERALERETGKLAKLRAQLDERKRVASERWSEIRDLRVRCRELEGSASKAKPRASKSQAKAKAATGAKTKGSAKAKPGAKAKRGATAKRESRATRSGPAAETASREESGPKPTSRRKRR